MKVLTVDDSKLIRRIIGGVIETLGYDYVEAAQANEAIEKIEENYSDIFLILLDWNMPGISGFQLLQNLKANERYKNIPVIMITQEGNQIQIEKAINTGALDYLIKPFNHDTLLSKLRQAIIDIPIDR